MPFPIQVVLCSKEVPQSIRTEFSSRFLNTLTACVSEQIYDGNRNYKFISNEEEVETVEDDLSIGKTDLMSNAMSEKFDTELKQIIENKLKFQKNHSCIFLSSVTAATVSAASSAIRGTSPWQQDIVDRSRNLPDSVVFTCNHSFPRYYMDDVILPEFTKRIQGLPKPLPETARMLHNYYTQTGALIPAACPCCVYNSMRQEQLNLLQETGGELSLHKSTFWEV